MVSSWFITAYLLIKSERDNRIKDQIYINGLVDSMEGFLEHAVTLNYQLSLNPQVIDTLRDQNDWKIRQESYADKYNTTVELNKHSGFPILSEMHLKYSFVELFFLQDAQGNQTARSYGMIGQRAERWWFKQISEKKDYRPFISFSYYSLTGHKPAASIFHPILENGSFLGILGMDINFQHLQNLVEEYVKSNDMYAIVTDMNGVIIAHPDTEKIDNIYNLIKMTRSTLQDKNGALNDEGFLEQDESKLDWPEEIGTAVTAAVTGEQGEIRNIKVEHELSHIYYAPIPLTTEGNSGQNYAVLLVHKRHNLIIARNIIILSVAFFILTTVFLLFFIFRYQFSKNILVPIETLLHSMNISDDSEFTEINLETGDEFNLLAETYNDLRRKLISVNRVLLEKLEILQKSDEGYKAFADVGLALSTEKNISKLMEMILNEACKLTYADGGTLYLYDSENRHLDFAIIHTETMNIHMGGISGKPVTFPPVPLYNPDGKPNHFNVSSHAALTGNVINIPDVYHTDKFDFQGTRNYDTRNGYRSRSMLVIPMKNNEDTLIGVIQLINARVKGSDQVIPFSSINENLIRSLASQAAVALTNVQLQKELESLFHAFIKSIATAIDEKSAFTGGHIRRVVILTTMIAEEINREKEGAYAEIFFSDDQMEELHIAAWMHDIGKITTPETLIDKQTKLQGFHDGMNTIETRYQMLMQLCGDNRNFPKGEFCSEDLETELEFIKNCNRSGGFLTDENLEKLSLIRSKYFPLGEDTQSLLTDQELSSLSIRRGNLNSEERKQIEHHAVMTKRILGELPFPKHLENVAHYASMHHEKLNGSGYPEGLESSQIPLQARIIAVADIFEALTAKDRPYREPMKLSKAMDIMQSMVTEGHIDRDILNLMYRSGIISRYAESELEQSQVNEIQWIL
jgi:HD-GYP domain-containing protein (c-di-GMP phosphodiesterase class II)